MTQETTQQITGYTDVTHTTVQGKLCKSISICQQNYLSKL